MLAVEDIHTYYGESHILQGVSLEVREGSVAALLGRNGAGKTTTLKSIMGVVRPRRGAQPSFDLIEASLPKLVQALARRLQRGRRS